MNLLLDTHSAIWFLNGDNQLSNNTSVLIRNVQNNRFVSIASLWEVAIKIKTGKLELDFLFADFEENLRKNAMTILPVSFKHTKQLLDLELHHRDPFDRMIIAQSITENLTIISKDKNFSLYPIKLLW